MSEVITVQDLETLKKHEIFEAEVITGKVGGLVNGASIDYATNPVTGQIQKTMPAILRDLGFEPAGFDFTTGGTLGVNERNKAVLWPIPDGGDGDWYNWEGVLPKVVPPASTPYTTGGVANGAWRPVGDITLREELAAPTGGELIGISSGRNQADKNSDVISVLDKGALADSTTGTDGYDSTSAFLAAVTECKSTGKTLDIPKSAGGYRLTSVVDVRGINILDTGATLYVNHGGIGVILGGNASNANNPPQHIGTVIRPAINGVGGPSNPDIRVIGAKGQNIYVQFCVYMQLFADTAAPNRAANYSIGYSNFYLKNVEILELLGLGVPGDYGWINENQFYINRPDKILFAAGGYHHNHNKFYNGNYETAATIDLQVGSSNYFYGGRFERNGAVPEEILTINFAAGTWNNVVEATWLSSVGYANGPYNPANSVQVTDNGWSNAVLHAQDLYSDEVQLFALGSSTPFVSRINASQTGTLSFNTDMHGVRGIQHLVDGRFKILNNFLPLLADDRVIPLSLGDVIVFSSDAALFRPQIYLYDANGLPYITEPPAGAINSGGLVWSNGAYSTAGNTSFSQIYILSSAVSAIRIGINTGGATSGLTFKSIRMSMRSMKRFTNGPRRAFEIPPLKRKPSLTYFNDADINVANIGEGVPCYKTNLGEMKINLLRQRYVVLSVVGNVITVAGGNVQHFDGNTSLVAYTTSASDNATVAVSSISGTTITLVSTPPAEIVPGSNIDFIVSKTKILT